VRAGGGGRVGLQQTTNGGAEQFSYCGRQGDAAHASAVDCEPHHHAAQGGGDGGGGVEGELETQEVGEGLSGDWNRAKLGTGGEGDAEIEGDEEGDARREGMSQQVMDVLANTESILVDVVRLEVSIITGP